MIKKEFLKEVLGEEVVGNGTKGTTGKEINYSVRMSNSIISCSINICLLACKIKEWALKSNKPIMSVTDNYYKDNKGWAGVNFYFPDEGYDAEYEFECYGKNEAEAVIKAGEWIFKNKNRQAKLF